MKDFSLAIAATLAVGVAFIGYVAPATTVPCSSAPIEVTVPAHAPTVTVATPKLQPSALQTGGAEAESNSAARPGQQGSPSDRTFFGPGFGWG